MQPKVLNCQLSCAQIKSLLDGYQQLKRRQFSGSYDGDADEFNEAHSPNLQNIPSLGVEDQNRLQEHLRGYYGSIV